MIRTIKYRGLIKCRSRGGVNLNTSFADNTKRGLFMVHNNVSETGFDWIWRRSFIKRGTTFCRLQYFIVRY